MTTREYSLAEEVLEHPGRWPLVRSPDDLFAFLRGAVFRGACTRSEDFWRAVYGPLGLREFWQFMFDDASLVALAWQEHRWPFAMEEAFSGEPNTLLPVLQETLSAWRRRSNAVADPSEQPRPAWTGQARHASEEAIWNHLARIPLRFLPGASGQALKLFLHGAAAGGDRLGFPPLLHLGTVVTRIEWRSIRDYRNENLGYEREDATTLLGWAGYPNSDFIDPADPDATVYY